MKKSRLVVVGVVAAALVSLPVAYALAARRAGPSPTDLTLINGVVKLVENGYVHLVWPRINRKLPSPQCDIAVARKAG